MLYGGWVTVPINPMPLKNATCVMVPLLSVAVAVNVNAAGAVSDCAVVGLVNVITNGAAVTVKDCITGVAGL
ncbi:hypothetical protein S2091_4713 [Solimicrobium silvestre]|uniref:Uncharacterized protein n=1 Tax=Solimicrobium silvestre TaxID=2099400 RepID=A0A2S9GS99_9BURK|nr:hypothetical protein S2091_4713 [Solimicrobium silvestre]